MDNYYLAASPGGSGGRGSRWLDSSMRRRPRLPSPSGQAFLSPAFEANAAPAGCSGARGSSVSSSLSSDDLDLGFDDSLLRFCRRRASLTASPPAKTERFVLFGGSPPAAPTPEDEVLVMDGVLVYGGSGSRRSSSAADLRSGGRGGRYGSKSQFIHGKEEQRGGRALNTKSSGMELPSGRSVKSAGSNMKGPKTRSLPPLSLPGIALPIASVPGATRSIKQAANFIPPEATILATNPDLPTPNLKITLLPPPPPTSTFARPPTEEDDDALISQVLYGPSRRPRLPVFRDICP